jgi:hypothetical protein
MSLLSTSIRLSFGLALGFGAVWFWPAERLLQTSVKTTAGPVAIGHDVPLQATWETFSKTNADLRLPQLAGLLAEATENTISALAENFLTLTPEPTEMEWQLLFRRWVDFAPQAAFSFAKEHETKPARRALLAAMAWAELDAPTALQALLGHPENDIQSFLRSVAPRDPNWAWQIGEERNLWLDARVFIAALHRRDPASVAAFVDARKSPWDPAYLAKHWYAVDPASALAWVENLPGLEGQKAYGALLQSMAQRDPQAAAALLAKAPHSLPFLTAASQTATALAKQDPAAALAWVRGNFTGAAQQYALYGVIKGLTESNPDAALALLNEVGWEPKLDGTEKSDAHSRMVSAEDPDRVIGDLLGKLALTQPKKVLEQLKQGNLNSSFKEEMQLAVGTWMKQDLTGLIEFAKQVPFGPVPDPFNVYGSQLIESMAAQTAISNIVALLAQCRAANFPDGAAASLAEKIAGRLAVQDSNTGKSFIASLPVEWQPEATAAWLRGVAEVRPLEALESMWSFEADAVPPNLVANLTEKHPLQLRDQLQAHAELPAAVAVADDFVTDWMKTEPEAASSWVDQMPPSKLRDAAASGLIKGLVGQPVPDFQAAVAWLNVIQDEDNYFANSQHCYRAMIEVPASTRAAFVEGLRLDPLLKKSLFLGIDPFHPIQDPFAQ